MTGGPPPAAAQDGQTLAPPVALTAQEAATLAGGAIVHGDPATAVRGAAIDSRSVAAGMLFVALPGERSDGHRFVAEAFHRGAAAALVSDVAAGSLPAGVLIRVPDTLRAFQQLARAVRDRQALRVVGITGSVGKTSTKEMAAEIASRVFRTARSPENWNTEVGIPLVLMNLPHDREVAIVELAMRGPGQIRELVEIARPEIGVITNIGESHMDFFESRAELAAAKGELLEGLPPDGVAIVNAEDPLAVALLRRARARPLTFGLARGDVTAEAVQVHPGQGSTFRLRLPAGRVEVVLRVPGRHAIRNALAAAAVGLALGLPADEIAAGLRRVTPLPMRLEARRIGEITVLNDVYNSSPQSVEAALEVMGELGGAPRVAVLGDMKELGTRSAEAHRRVGRLAAGQRLDLVVAFGPLARALADAARAAGGVRVVHSADLEEVVAVLRRELRPGALVLVKGSRAMAMERIIAALEAPRHDGTAVAPEEPPGPHGVESAQGAQLAGPQPNGSGRAG